MARLGQLTHLLVSLAILSSFRCCCRRYSFRSGVWLLARSYSRALWAFLDFAGKGCLCLCGGVHLFLENLARLFLPLGLRGGFVPHSWLWSGGGVVMTLEAWWFCRLLFSGRSGPFLLFNGEGPLGDIPFYTTYPRACGGTVGLIQGPSYHPGLSPRLRGNRMKLMAP